MNWFRSYISSWYHRFLPIDALFRKFGIQCLSCLRRFHFTIICCQGIEIRRLRSFATGLSRILPLCLGLIMILKWNWHYLSVSSILKKDLWIADYQWVSYIHGIAQWFDCSNRCRTSMDSISGVITSSRVGPNMFLRRDSMVSSNTSPVECWKLLVQVFALRRNCLSAISFILITYNLAWILDVIRSCLRHYRLKFIHVPLLRCGLNGLVIMHLPRLVFIGIT